jgi:hypothetical protein
LESSDSFGIEKIVYLHEYKFAMVFDFSMPKMFEDSKKKPYDYIDKEPIVHVPVAFELPL